MESKPNALHLPVRDEDIFALTERFIKMIGSAPGLVNEPPAPVEALGSDLVTFRAAVADYEAKRAAAQDAAVAKHKARLTCLTHLRRLRDWMDASFAPDDPVHEQIGFAAITFGALATGEFSAIDEDPTLREKERP